MKNVELESHGSSVQWSVVLIGAVVALAITVVLTQFGAAVGLSADESLLEGSAASWGVIAIGVWLLWTQLVSSMAGGYIAGSMRNSTPHVTAYQNEMRDGFYGLAVWATSTVAVFIALAFVATVATYTEVNTGTDQIADAMSANDENKAIIFAFVTGASSVVSAAVAWWASVKAGDHKAKGIDFSEKYSFLR